MSVRAIWTIIAVAALAGVLAGCAAVMTPLPAVLYSDVTVPVDYEEGGGASQSYQILGPAEGTATATSFFGIVAIGDASVYTAYRNALAQYPNADGLIDVTVDNRVTSAMAILGQVTTIVRGKAVKRQKGPLKVPAVEKPIIKEKKEARQIEQVREKPKKEKPIVPKKRAGIVSLPGVPPELSSLESQLIGEWELVSMTFSSGKILGPETSSRGYLIFEKDRTTKLVLVQNEKKAELQGIFYADGTKSVVLKVHPPDQPEVKRILHYTNISFEQGFLNFVTKDKRVYQWRRKAEE